MDTQALLLKPDEVARTLNLSRGRVYQLLKSGSLPCVRIGKALRVPRAQLVAWVERAQEPSDKGAKPRAKRRGKASR